MNFSQLYHAHYSGHLDDLPFWLELADRYKSPILELGCGTGRVLLPLVKAGHQVFGLDTDYAMLSLLKDHHARELVRPALIFQSDILSFNLDASFNLILLTCNTWSTIEPSDRAGALERIHSHLSSSGLFATSIPNPALLLDLPSSEQADIEESFEHPVSGNPVQVSSSWEQKEDYFTVTWFYDHLMPDGSVERLKVEAAHHLTDTDTYLNELHTAGFQISALWGDFDRSPYSPDSPYLILAANKK